MKLPQAKHWHRLLLVAIMVEADELCVVVLADCVMEESDCRWRVGRC